MTGFGRASAQVGEVVVQVEIRALNARQTDIRFKMPMVYRELESPMRTLLQQQAFRGKIDVLVERKDAQGGDLSQGINQPLFQRYRKQLIALAPALADNEAGLVASVLRLPNVVGTTETELTEIETEKLQEAFNVALQDFLAFRHSEGESLTADLALHANAIADAISGLEAFEAIRIAKMRKRLERLIEENLTGSAVDQSRLEQEVLFYLEKIDISEEKVRLGQHCIFFIEKLEDSDPEKGRRLNFIAQEMGREINTLGAKAYSSDIQRVVVGMKEELEKIKEQIANIV
jgi:uncharacterized protein (TIGR00255 family)